ncbi:MAG: tetratricopeptide repeat protein [Planctomycetota bacterium]
MLKSIGTIQLALATVFIVPAVTGQDEAGRSLESQLDATVRSLEYIAGLRESAAAGDRSAVRAIVDATQEATETAEARAERLSSLREDIARLRLALDDRFADPREVRAVTGLPPSVVHALGLAGRAPARDERLPAASTDGVRPIVSTTAPTAGLDAAARESLTTEIRPLDRVSSASRRRGGEVLPLEQDGYVADPARLGRLLVRADRSAEAIEILEGAPETPAVRYWLARAYQVRGRLDDALEILRPLSTDVGAGEYARYAERELDFLEFQRSLDRQRRGEGGAR